MARFCVNGHPVEDTWEVCPYCQHTGFQPHGAAADRTRIELGSARGEKPVDAGATLLRPRPPRAPLVGWLVALDGPQQGEDYRLRDGQNFIGCEAQADVRLTGESVGERHASLRHRDGVFTLTDLDCPGGTYVNECAASIVREVLEDNDVIRIGGISLRFKRL